MGDTKMTYLDACIAIAGLWIMLWAIIALKILETLSSVGTDPIVIAIVELLWFVALIMFLIEIYKTMIEAKP
jgi:hypothetical protein